MCKLLGCYYLEGSKKGDVIATRVLSKSSLASICFFLLVLKTKRGTHTCTCIILDTIFTFISILGLDNQWHSLHTSVFF